MKKNILFTVIIGVSTILSCSDENKYVDTLVQPKASIVGKVYGLVFNSKICEQVPLGTDYIPKLLFLDDSSFIEIIPANCGDLGKDFKCSRHYSGKYKMGEQFLTLTFYPKMIVHYIKSKNNPKSDTLLSSSHIEIEKSDMSIEQLTIHYCKNTPYFEPCDAQRHFMAPTTDSLANNIKYLKDEKILDKLFDKK